MSAIDLTKVKISWLEVAHEFSLRYDEVFLRRNAKAHFDFCDVVIDGAKERWRHLLLMDAVLSVILNKLPSDHRSVRRQFEHHEIFRDCLLQIFRRNLNIIIQKGDIPIVPISAPTENNNVNYSIVSDMSTGTASSSGPLATDTSSPTSGNSSGLDKTIATPSIVDSIEPSKLIENSTGISPEAETYLSALSLRHILSKQDNTETSVFVDVNGNILNLFIPYQQKSLSHEILVDVYPPWNDISGFKNSVWKADRVKKGYVKRKAIIDQLCDAEILNKPDSLRQILNQVTMSVLIVAFPEIPKHARGGGSSLIGSMSRYKLPDKILAMKVERNSADATNPIYSPETMDVEDNYEVVKDEDDEDFDEYNEHTKTRLVSSELLDANEESPSKVKVSSSRLIDSVKHPIETSFVATNPSSISENETARKLARREGTDLNTIDENANNPFSRYVPISVSTQDLNFPPLPAFPQPVNSLSQPAPPTPADSISILRGIRVRPNCSPGDWCSPGQIVGYFADGISQPSAAALCFGVVTARYPSFMTPSENSQVDISYDESFDIGLQGTYPVMLDIELLLAWQGSGRSELLCWTTQGKLSFWESYMSKSASNPSLTAGSRIIGVVMTQSSHASVKRLPNGNAVPRATKPSPMIYLTHSAELASIRYETQMLRLQMQNLYTFFAATLQSHEVIIIEQEVKRKEQEDVLKDILNFIRSSNGASTSLPNNSIGNLDSSGLTNMRESSSRMLYPPAFSQSDPNMVFYNSMPPFNAAAYGQFKYSPALPGSIPVGSSGLDPRRMPSSSVSQSYKQSQSQNKGRPQRPDHF